MKLNCQKKKKRCLKKLRFIYPRTISKNPKRNINNYIQVKKIIKHLDLDEETLFIYDPLSFDASMGFLSATKKLNIEKIALVTDLPMYISAIQKNGNSRFQYLKGWIKQKIFLFTTRMATGFCFLTESMNCINIPKRPYVVIEGISSFNREVIDVVKLNKNHVVMYAGGLYEKFGINDLVDAVIEMEEHAI